MRILDTVDMMVNMVVGMVGKRIRETLNKSPWDAHELWGTL